MKIDSEGNQASLRSRWGVPLGVAAGVAALSVGAVALFSGAGEAQPVLASPAGNPSGAAASPSAGATHDSTSGGVGKAPTSAPDTFTVTSGKTTPIDSGTVSKILSSCLGSDASRYEAVIGVRTPLASKDWDGVVVAVDSAGQYVQCESKGDKGNSPDSPPTFINNRLWGTGHTIAYFDSIGAPVGKKQLVMLGAGHHAPNVAKVTISYGDDPKQYPAVMAGGAFVYAAALSTDSSHIDRRDAAGPNPYVHAFDASGKEIYNQAKDPQFAG
ncbi:hypothetical protein P8A21_11805 [Streptomyces poriferorum]|uniref:hypothetical protein n=1 Tax=Streptomyces TaxID=1883 RepID=UPI001C5F555C|nr:MULTISPECIES: hypothetical protein [Streptomyces]MBW5252652.1 hypothetical protein [Streptomyces poriferorum]MBW5260420.1 hypothetical protein [Streptomyces poriferorum]WLQ48143.1 hypothetical protein P8A21_11805 [Streptomyces sp. Alt1]